jgi:adenylylsulfate kinase
MTTWVLLAGLPATGKSTLARALAKHLKDAAILDKDRVRAALFPGSMTDYASEQDELCMRAMIEAAAYMTQHRQTAFIFFDGRTFSRSAQIDAVIHAATTAGATWRILHLTCSDTIAEARLRTTDADHPARNRDMELYRRVQAAFEPILYPKLNLDTTPGVETLLSRATDYLRA